MPSFVGRMVDTVQGVVEVEQNEEKLPLVCLIGILICTHILPHYSMCLVRTFHGGDMREMVCGCTGYIISRDLSSNG